MIDVAALRQGEQQQTGKTNAEELEKQRQQKRDRSR